MKKRLILVTLAGFVLFNNINSQDLFNKSQLGISVGPSFPVGKYADKNIYNQKAGVASMGAAIKISYIHRSNTNKNLNLTASLIGQLNPIERNSIETSFSTVKISFAGPLSWSGSGEPPRQTQEGTSYSNWNFAKSYWKLGALLAGASGEFKTGSPNIAVTSTLQAGLAYVTCPELNGRSITDSTDLHVTQSKASAFGFAYAVSVGIKIRPNARTFFIAGADFFGTNNITFKEITAQITGVKHRSNPAGTIAFQSSVTSTTSQTINSLNVFAGLGIRL